MARGKSKFFMTVRNVPDKFHPAEQGWKEELGDSRNYGKLPKKEEDIVELAKKIVSDYNKFRNLERGEKERELLGVVKVTTKEIYSNPEII